MKYTKYFCEFSLFLILLSLSTSYKTKHRNFLSSAQAKNPPKPLSTVPLFSFTESITQNVFLNEFKFSLYKVSKGEAIQIFNFIDKKHKGMIKPSDWDDFVSLYLAPFEKCDTKKEYLLEKADLQKCFEGEPTSKFIIPPAELKDKFYDIIIDILDINNALGKKINFYSYLMLRKAMFSWKECHNDGSSMTANSFKCAISYASGSYIDKYNLENMHLSAMMDSGELRMDFISFLRIFTALHIFEILGARKDKFRLDKDAFEKSALKEDKIINFISQEEIDQILSFSDSEVSKSINFETFNFFFNLYKLYNIHAKDKSGIAIEEAVSSVDHLLFPSKIKNFIDLSLTNFKADEYKKITDDNAARLGEKKYFFSFLEKSMTHMKGNPNPESRKVFFSMFLGNKDPKKLSKTEYSKPFVYASLFETFYSNGGKSNQAGCISVEKLNKKIEKAYHEGVLKFNEQSKFASQIFRKLPSDLNIDIILFNSIETMNPHLYNNLDGFCEKTLNENYGMKEIPEDKLGSGSGSAEEKLQSLLNLFTMQAKVANSKREEASKNAKKG